MRAFLVFMFMAFASAGAPKGGKADGKAPKLESPTLSPSPVASASNNAKSGNQTVVLLDLKAVATNFFKLFENERFEDAARLFAPGMFYVTNGRTYEVDLSVPADIKSIPKRSRSQIVWTYTDSDDYEIWGHCLVTYPGNPQPEPEFMIFHFNRNGLIDMFSHIQPKAAQCTAVKDVVKLALMRPDGTIVDAPQDQLERMLAEQEASAKLASSRTNSTTIRSSNSTIQNSTIQNSATQNSTTTTQNATTTTTRTSTTTGR